MTRKELAPVGAESRLHLASKKRHSKRKTWQKLHPGEHWLWKRETRKSKLENGKWKLETRDQKPAIRT
jgi:hypothetical protein